MRHRCGVVHDVTIYDKITIAVTIEQVAHSLSIVKFKYVHRLNKIEDVKECVLANPGAGKL